MCTEKETHQTPRDYRRPKRTKTAHLKWVEQQQQQRFLNTTSPIYERCTHLRSNSYGQTANEIFEFSLHFSFSNLHYNVENHRIHWLGYHGAGRTYSTLAYRTSPNPIFGTVGPQITVCLLPLGHVICIHTHVFFSSDGPQLA